MRIDGNSRGETWSLWMIAQGSLGAVRFLGSAPRGTSAMACPGMAIEMSQGHQDVGEDRNLDMLHLFEQIGQCAQRPAE